MTATEIVQAFVGFPGTIAPRAHKSLKAFARVELDPGESRIVHLAIPLNALAYRDSVSHEWRIEAGRHRLYVGGCSSESSLLDEEFML